MKNKFVIILLSLTAVLAGCVKSDVYVRGNLKVGFKWDQEEPSVGSEVQFTNFVNGVNLSSSKDYSFQWTFGDGSYNSSSSELNPTHTYYRSGYHTVGLKVVKDGEVFSYSKDIYVLAYDETQDKQTFLDMWASAPNMMSLPGLTIKKLEFNEEYGTALFGSNQVVTVVKAVLNAGGTSLKFGVGAQLNGSQTKKLSEFISERNAVLAINGSFWKTLTAQEAARAQAINPKAALPRWDTTIVAGNNALDYVRMTNAAGVRVVDMPNFNYDLTTERSDRRSGNFSLNAAGKMTMRDLGGATFDNEATITHVDVMTGGPLLVSKSNVVPLYINAENYERRNCSGTGSVDNNNTYLVFVESGTEDAAGMSIGSELSYIFKWLGCNLAMNLGDASFSALRTRDMADDEGRDPFMFNALLLLDAASTNP